MHLELPSSSQQIWKITPSRRSIWKIIKIYPNSKFPRQTRIFEWICTGDNCWIGECKLKSHKKVVRKSWLYTSNCSSQMHSCIFRRVNLIFVFIDWTHMKHDENRSQFDKKPWNPFKFVWKSKEQLTVWSWTSSNSLIISVWFDSIIGPFFPVCI